MKQKTRQWYLKEKKTSKVSIKKKTLDKEQEREQWKLQKRKYREKMSAQKKGESVKKMPQQRGLRKIKKSNHASRK